MTCSTFLHAKLYIIHTSHSLTHSLTHFQSQEHDSNISNTGTPGVAKLAPAADSQKKIANLIPLGRMGETSEIGLTSVFLCSSAAQYITGTTLIVDGGEWLYKPPPLPRDMVSKLSKQVEAKSRRMGPKSSRL